MHHNWYTPSVDNIDASGPSHPRVKTGVRHHFYELRSGSDQLLGGYQYTPTHVNCFERLRIATPRVCGQPHHNLQNIGCVCSALKKQRMNTSMADTTLLYRSHPPPLDPDLCLFLNQLKGHHIRHDLVCT
jgi:hypothetical protein